MENLKTTLSKCPKAFKKYKAYLIQGMKEKYPDMDDIEKTITNDLLIHSVVATPYPCATFFDTVGLIGTYTQFGDKFVINVNNEVIEDKTSGGKEEKLLGSTDRKETEEILIKYLFTELEKTL
jgi:hypothetical protein